MKTKKTEGKQKGQPKLKTILASPYRIKSPTLPETELEQLRDLLIKAIQNSDKEPKVFATTTNIHLGLESTLRAINAYQTSGVLLSLRIKPHFMIGMIAQNCKVKNETVPVYAQPQLEQFTKEVFGVSALALALPLNVEKLGFELKNWITARAKPKKMKITKIMPTTTKRKREKTATKQTKPESKEEKEAIELPPVVENKNWTGDFLSFSNSSYNIQEDESKMEQDKIRLLDALNKMSENANAQQTVPSKFVTKMDTDRVEEKEDIDSAGTNELTNDLDDFLQEYQPLTVHKIRPNPAKKSKKKRKKNKQNK